MCFIRKVIAISMICLLVVTVVMPRQAYSAVPVVIPAGAKIVTSAILTALGIDFLTSDGENAAVQRAWESIPAGTRKEISDYGDLLISGGTAGVLLTERIYDDFLLARDEIIEMAESGEPFELTTVSPGEIISPPANFNIMNDYGLVMFATTTGWFFPGGSGGSFDLTLSAINISGYKYYIRLYSNNVGTGWAVVNCQVGDNYGSGHTHYSEEVARVPMEGTSTTTPRILGEHVIGMSLDADGNMGFYLNDVNVLNLTLGGYVLDSVSYTAGSKFAEYYPLQGVYSEVSAGEMVMQEGIDYELINELIANQALLASLIGQTLTVDGTGVIDQTVYTPGTITVPEAPAVDIPGIGAWINTIVQWLQNIWNSIVQGLESIRKLLLTLVGAIGAQLDPDVFTDPINDIKIFVMDKVPQLPDVDMSGFEDREWNWMITLNYPWQISFEVLNSEMLESARPRIKGFTSGIMYFLTMLYIYRRVPEIVRG